MATWNANQYLRFSNERTQPAVDLAARIAVSNPSAIVDLGCGPGNSTRVVAQRWPAATVTGVDNSAAMLQSAAAEGSRIQWENADIAAWAAHGGNRGKWDVVFSNAALQWVPDHTRVVPQLLDSVAPAGALAFQVPYTLHVSHQRRIREVAERWSNRFLHEPAAWHVETAEFYYDLLAPRAAKVHLWITDYAHVLESPAAIVEWYRGTGLRPYLEALPDQPARDAFLADYLTAITPDHPPRADGKVLMYFRRLFVIAYR